MVLKRPFQSNSHNFADGGGIRGLQSLHLLDRLMEKIDFRNPPLPCKVFDMIGGTSTGG